MMKSGRAGDMILCEIVNFTMVLVQKAIFMAPVHLSIHSKPMSVKSRSDGQALYITKP